MKKRLTIIITTALLIIIATVAFADGNAGADNTDQPNQSALERMDDFDWSKTCPAASCRSHNEE